MGLDPVRFGVLWCRLLSMNEHLSHSAALGESLPAPHLLDIVTRHTGATICVVDTSLNILYANEAYANWFKVRPKELLGRTLTSLYSEAARAQSARRDGAHHVPDRGHHRARGRCRPIAASGAARFAHGAAEPRCLHGAGARGRGQPGRAGRRRHRGVWPSCSWTWTASRT